MCRIGDQRENRQPESLAQRMAVARRVSRSPWQPSAEQVSTISRAVCTFPSNRVCR